MSNLTFDDGGDDKAIVTTHYNLAEVKAVAEYAKGLHNAGMDKALDGGDKLVASVHPAIVHKWCADNGVTFDRLMCDPAIAKRFLEDPNNAHFRVWRGAI